MISIGSEKISVDGVDVYPDHESATQFWFLPGTVQLAERERAKALSYLWYTDSASDSSGTGFLNFEVNTAVPQTTLARIKGEIAAKKRLAQDKVALSAVPYTGGNVSFSVLGPMAKQAAAASAADPSVLYTSEEQLVWNAGSSSLVGDNAAVCSVRFTKEGRLAAAMKQAILSGSNAVAALYRLDFLAMRPSVTFKVTGTMEKTIRDFQASIGTSIPLQALVLDVGIQGQWQKILSKTDLKIEVTNFDGANASDGLKLAQQILLDYLLKNFFEVSIGRDKDNWSPLKEAPEVSQAVEKAANVEQAAGAKAEGEGKTGDAAAEAVKETVKAATIFIPKVNIRAAYYSGREVNTIDFLYSERKATPMVVLPQALVLAGLGDDEAARRRYVTQVNRAQDPFGLPYNVSVALPGPDSRAKLGLTSINVTARYPAGAPADRQATCTLAVNGPDVTGVNPMPFQYDRAGSSKIDYEVDYVFDPGSDWQGDAFTYSRKGQSDGAQLIAMPESVVDCLTLTVGLSSDFLWEDNDQAVVELTSKRWGRPKRVVFRAGGAAVQTLKLRSDVKFRDEPVTCTVEVMTQGRAAYRYGPEVVIGEAVTVRDRFGDHVPVLFTAEFADADSLDILLSYSEGASTWEESFTLDRDQKNVRRIVPTVDKHVRSTLKIGCEVYLPSGESYRIEKTRVGVPNRVRDRVPG